MPENKEIKESLEKTIDTLFSDTPGAPVSPKATAKPAAKRTAPKAAPKVQTPQSDPGAEVKGAEPEKQASKAEVKAEPKTEAKKAPATAPKAEAKAETAKSAPKTALTVSELKKLMNAEKEPKPLEPTPAWSIIMTVCTLILALSAAGVAVLAAYFYFGPGSAAAEGNVLIGYVAMVMCIVVCGVFVGFAAGIAFMLRKIEKDIREIKSRL